MLVRVDIPLTEKTLYCTIVGDKPAHFLGTTIVIDPFVGKRRHKIPADIHSLVGRVFEIEDNPHPYLYLPSKFTEVKEEK